MTQAAPQSALLTRVITAAILSLMFLSLLLFAAPWLVELVLWAIGCLAAYEFGRLQSHSKIVYPNPLAKKVASMSHLALGVLYLGLPFWIMHKLTRLPDFRFWFLLAITATALGDSFAYFGGRAFGKHKLAPQISPNKTVEGAVFAFFGGMAGSILLHLIFANHVPLWQQSLLGIALAGLGILGDLFESALKRAFGVKDSGAILPGHGGILDRIDAYLFTLPFVFFYAWGLSSW